MQEMIEAEPGLAEPVLADPAASSLGDMVRTAADAGAPLAVVGCGTSEHGAMAVAEQLTDALGGRAVAHSRQAFEAMLDPWGSGVCIGISHEGGTAATVAAMESARAAGATVGLITAVADSAGAKAADNALVTPVRDRSWCHTVGYVSPILGGAAVAASVSGERPDTDAAARALSVTPDIHDRIRAVAASLFGVTRYLPLGSGADRIAARELALKIEEGVRVAATARELETILHGHWVAQDEGAAVILLMTDPRRARARADRAAQMLRAASAIGARTAAILTDVTESMLGPDLPAGRIVVPAPSGLPDSTASLLASAPALQLLTLELVHLAGVNPDLIRREDAPYREAAAIAESSFPAPGA
jgi:fructoselysine-6-P-deglycase FrlB-like protein